MNDDVQIYIGNIGYSASWLVLVFLSDHSAHWAAFQGSNCVTILAKRRQITKCLTWMDFRLLGFSSWIVLMFALKLLHCRIISYWRWLATCGCFKIFDKYHPLIKLYQIRPTTSINNSLLLISELKWGNVKTKCSIWNTAIARYPIITDFWLMINDVNQLLLRTSFLAPGRKCSAARDATGLSIANQIGLMDRSLLAIWSLVRH